MHCRLWTSSCFLLLLVTALSRRHLVFAARLPTRSSSSSEEPSSAAYSVVWSSPAPGDRFGSGDTIVGEWQVTPRNQKVVSPSFRLCMGGEDGCGATVWPEVVEESEGSYRVSLTAPSVTAESGYYLQMKDDFGHTYSSPIYNITPTPQKKNKPAEHQPDVAQPRPDQAPLSSSSSSGTNSNPAAAPAVASPAAGPSGVLPLPSAAGLSPNSAATPNPSSSGPQVAAVHNAPPVAAIAVPLSLTGAIILLAGGLALHHRRRLAAERERAAWSSRSSWPWNKDGRSAALSSAFDLGGCRRHGGSSSSNRDSDVDVDVEKSLFAAPPAMFRGAWPGHHHHHHTHDGFFPEKAAVMEAAAADPLYSSYAPSYAEPRQRTRGLDPLAREFTTSTTTRPSPSPRPLAHPSPSLSSYRGLLGRHYTIRRSTRSSNDNNDNNGSSSSGSLWRSLSFVARHKKVLPPVPSALNSPTMTVVTSVTSEVLPSYLPSPNIDGATADQAHGGEPDHGAGVGDSGFENVPLSPPLPAPLHTRGEAADPDDSRMRELRGVYEAVARALGSTHGV